MSVEYPESYIYFIGAAAKWPVKIGMSASPYIRLRALQTSSPYLLEVLAQHRGGEMVEAKLHRVFDEQRMMGEWFERTKKLQKLIEMVRAKTDLTEAVLAVFRNNEKVHQIMSPSLVPYRPSVIFT